MAHCNERSWDLAPGGSLWPPTLKMEQTPVLRFAHSCQIDEMAVACADSWEPVAHGGVGESRQRDSELPGRVSEQQGRIEVAEQSSHVLG